MSYFEQGQREVFLSSVNHREALKAARVYKHGTLEQSLGADIDESGFLLPGNFNAIN